MYLATTTHTESLELSTTIVGFCFKAEDDWLFKESHTTPYQNSFNQHSMKFFSRLDLREKMIVKKRTLMVFLKL